MKYRMERYNFFSRETFRVNLFKICVFSILIISVFLFKTILASPNEGVVNKIYTKILGFSFPNLIVGNYKEEKSNFKFSFNDILNPKKDIIKREIPFLKAVNYDNSIYNVQDVSEKIAIDSEFDIDYTDAEIKSFILNDSSIKLNKKDSNKKLVEGKARVLIYHTHTGEAYYPIEDDPSRSRDNNYNVCAVGEKIKKILEDTYNVKVIHDIKVHDDNYTKSYQKSRETLKEYLALYGDFDLIIDLHRDSIENKAMSQCNIANEKAAKFMFVMCTNNPNYNKQKKLVDKLLNITKEKYPQILRANGICTYNNGIGYYSQDLSSNCLLIECGTNLNTIDEALVTGKYLSEILGKYLTRE